jgi:hypothetical protein
MQQVNLTDIDSQRAEIERARRMAQLLQDQASAPIQSMAGPGVAAPVSHLQGLAAMLAQYGALRKEKKAAEDERKANELERSQANDFLSNLDKAPDAASEMMDTGVPTADLKPSLFDALKARIGGGPVPSIPNKPVLGQGDFVAPRPAMGTGAMAPAPGATITPGQARTPQEKMAMLLAASNSGNKILRETAPSLYTEARKDEKAGKVFDALGKAGDAGADPAILGAYRAANDAGGAVSYLRELGLKNEEVKATLAELKFKSVDKELDRQSREQIAAENRADRQEARAQAHADRMMIAGMSANRGKPLPTKVQNDLAELGGNADTAQRLLENFNGNYVGAPVIGGARKAYNKIMGSDDPASLWWQDYDAYQNAVRHTLFGAALTATERKEWEKATVRPGDAPSVAKNNLARQNQIAQTALARRAKSSVSMGYNPQAVFELTGRDPASLSTKAPVVQAGGKKRLKYNPATGALE